MLRGNDIEEKKTEEEEDALEEEIILEILREGRGDREERGERDEWNQHIGWHRKEDTNRIHQGPQSIAKKKNDNSGPAVLNQLGEGWLIGNTIKESKRHSVRGSADLFQDHDRGHPDSPQIGRYERTQNLDAHDHFGVDRSHYRHDTEIVSLPMLPSFVSDLAIIATIFFVFLVWLSIRRELGHMRILRRCGTKGRTL